MNKKILCMMAPAKIVSKEGDDSGPPTFEVIAYTGGAMSLAGWDLPVVIDLKGMNFANNLIANLDHDASKRVGQVTAKEITESTLTLSGIASASTESRREVIESAKEGFVWQASVEATPDVITEVGDGEAVTVNGQEFTGPLYVGTKTTLTGFGFVSHGADDQTQVTIAATATNSEDDKVDSKLTAWLEEIGCDDIENISDEKLATLKANYAGSGNPPAKVNPDDPFAARKAEAKRRAEIRAEATRFIEMRNADVEEIEAIERQHDHAIKTKMSAQDFRLAMFESCVPIARPVVGPKRENSLNDRILGAAICQAGRLPDIEKHYSEQELQAAHTEFKGRIGLKQLFLLAAERNTGQNNNRSGDIGRDTLRAAFNVGLPAIRAGSFSTLDIGNVTAATANKFIHRGWNMVDQTALRISRIQSVRNFQTATTVSLTDSVIYEKVGAAGEIKHGTLSDLTYTNKVDTYGKLLAITRQDIINDDLGALTDVPTKLGNGAMKKLNDIFWTKFLGLVSDSFFAGGNSNINTGVAEVTTAGLTATEVIFMNQTNPDSTPLGIEAAIMLVPTALKSDAFTLMNSEKLIDGTSTALQGDANIWRGRFRVESSPYISNSTYTGNTSVAWWLLANPEEMPVITIAALNGQVEPTVETGEADFDKLGVQMRGYSDVGVNSTEYRGGVHADGGSS